MFGLSPIIVILAVLAFTSLKILNEYERGVVFTLGRCSGIKGPGLIFLIPVIQQMTRISLRTVVL
ncbi:MAG: SPFH domain-containing protein, partial [Elusimicrobiota bacterium]